MMMASTTGSRRRRFTRALHASSGSPGIHAHSLNPEGSDGLTQPWGASNYVNPPFGSIIHQGKKKGPTAWVRKAIAEHKQGKRVVLVYPVDKWVLMLLAAGASVRNLGDIKWLATEDGSAGKGTGRHVACFVLEPEPT